MPETRLRAPYSSFAWLWRWHDVEAPASFQQLDLAGLSVQAVQLAAQQRGNLRAIAHSVIYSALTGNQYMMQWRRHILESTLRAASRSEFAYIPHTATLGTARHLV